MKLLIQDNLYIHDLDVETIKNLQKVCERFCLWNNEIKQSNGQYTLEIVDQKVTLEEWSMNELFHEVLCFTEHDLTYAALGGEGCDFSIEITNKFPAKLEP